VLSNKGVSVVGAKQGQTVPDGEGEVGKLEEKEGKAPYMYILLSLDNDYGAQSGFAM
jgi:hypothetical protein